MYLIRIGNTLFNVSQLVDADFIPAHEGVDEETEKPFKRAACIKLRFAAPRSVERSGYNGDYRGEQAEPYTFHFVGADAINVWDTLSKLATIGV